MEIDLNLPGQPSLEAVRLLLAQGDDRQHCQLRVSDRGMAWLSSTAVGGQALQGGCAFAWKPGRRVPGVSVQRQQRMMRGLRRYRPPCKAIGLSRTRTIWISTDASC